MPDRVNGVLSGGVKCVFGGLGGRRAWYNRRYYLDWEVRMPFVRVSMWSGRTHEQKAGIAKLITEALTKAADIPAEATMVVFEDIDKENWAIGGVPASDR